MAGRPPVTKVDDPGLTKVLTATGGYSGLARLVGVSLQAVMKWRRVPAERIVQVEQATGVSRAEQRPELYEGWSFAKKAMVRRYIADRDYATDRRRGQTKKDRS